MVQQPPIRKLGVFELDQFFPPKDRMAFAMRLNGLLASPSFGAWMTGPPLDIASMLETPDGKPRCAIVTTAHLSDQERQFVTTLILSKLVTWMRKQSGTTDLRALLYMDEVAGYLPPTATPPTKKPIMTLMKQARAFGVGVVLSTQNPVDVDYKALSNAGTWMIGRLQTDHDKQRLLDGMSAASGGVDVNAVGDTIAGLAKREFVLRRAGKDQPEVFTTRWAMSYLRGPLTRDQIATLMADQKADAGERRPRPTSVRRLRCPLRCQPCSRRACRRDPARGSVNDETSDAARGRRRRPGALGRRRRAVAGHVGGDPRGTRYEAAIVARVALRYDDDKADLVHDEEYEAVLFPLTEPVDVSRAIAVDYDDRDLRPDAPNPCVYRLPDVAVKNKTFWTRVERDLIDHLVRSRTVDLQANRDLKLFGRPGETADDFAARCLAAANDLADKETAELRDKYADKVTRMQTQIQAAEDRAEVSRHRAQGPPQRRDPVDRRLDPRRPARWTQQSRRHARLDPRQGRQRRRAPHAHRPPPATVSTPPRTSSKACTSNSRISRRNWPKRSPTSTPSGWRRQRTSPTLSVPLERTDVKVTQLVLVWIPVP